MYENVLIRTRGIFIINIKVSKNDNINAANDKNVYGKGGVKVGENLDLI